MSSIAKFITVRPVGSKNREIISKDMETFQSIMGMLEEKDYDALLKVLKEE